MASRLLLAAGIAAALGLPWPARAEEIPRRLNVPMILDLLSRPVDPPGLGEAARRDAAAPPAAGRADGGEVLPDGSVRYGRGNGSLTVTVRNPCPPGDLEHEALVSRPLPGRGRQ
jgi:hypothetical protein